jgi:ribosomal protein S18 acetylase RimI-like enzyme
MPPIRSPKPARPDEIRAAFRLLFQHLSSDECAARVCAALELLQQGKLDRQGIFVLHEEEGLAGVQLCLPLAGAMGLVWPPQARAGSQQRHHEDRLLQAGCAWLRRQGIKLAQALLSPDEVPQGEPLLRQGFLQVTHLWYLRHDLTLPLPYLDAPARLQFRSYAEIDPFLFQQVLQRTYEHTLDCPEINGLRTMDEVVRGHQAQGRHDPRCWWLASCASRPVGVLITTDLPDANSWDLSYLGVVPEARRRGFGREMVLQALCEARAAGTGRIGLCVDGRNRPAWDLYRALGFEPYDRREVLLALWPASSPLPHSPAVGLG